MEKEFGLGRRCGASALRLVPRWIAYSQPQNEGACRSQSAPAVNGLRIRPEVSAIPMYATLAER